MSESNEQGNTVRITRPPNTYFHAGEEYYVKAVRTNGVVVHRMGVDLILSPINFEIANKDWRMIHCPRCGWNLGEIDRKTFTHHSVRLRCQNYDCHEFTVVRGVRPMRFNESQIEAITADLKHKLDSGEYQPLEATISLFAMAQAGRLTERDVEAIIKDVYKGKATAAMAVLARAREIISGDLIDQIIGDKNDR